MCGIIVRAPSCVCVSSVCTCDALAWCRHCFCWHGARGALSAVSSSPAHHYHYHYHYRYHYHSHYGRRTGGRARARVRACVRAGGLACASPSPPTTPAPATPPQPLLPHPPPSPPPARSLSPLTPITVGGEGQSGAGWARRGGGEGRVGGARGEAVGEGVGGGAQYKFSWMPKPICRTCPTRLN